MANLTTVIGNSKYYIFEYSLHFLVDFYGICLLSFGIIEIVIVLNVPYYNDLLTCLIASMHGQSLSP